MFTTFYIFKCTPLDWYWVSFYQRRIAPYAHAKITNLAGEERFSNYGVPVSLLDSSSLSFSCLNRRLKNPVSLSFASVESFEELGFVLLDDLGVLNYQNHSRNGDYLGISCVLRAVVSFRAVASCSSRLRSYGPRFLGMLTLKSIR